MLVLSRKRNEVICIGENIYVKVLNIHGGKVRLGIEASREIPVRRAELPDPKPSELQEDIPVDASLEAIT
ncbi:MAG: carbon storage regulator [Planctomycetes bacterium]|nr:carbon storage regulator [Planctomycetota bacterium]MCH9724266.1 carbon storage regulator [Planctomycetota bacterium]MCH9778977.1 carbon storage regulator [Planctomycetota bacterium]MDF1744099.1 carbon storage regulator [Gimesia sp.]